MLAWEHTQLELLEHMQLLVVTFRGVVKFGLVLGTRSGRFGTWGRLGASKEKLLLRWGLFSIKIDNEVLDFMRDWDCREDVVGGTMNAT